MSEEYQFENVSDDKPSIDFTLERLKTGQGFRFARNVNLPQKSILEQKVQASLGNRFEPILDLPPELESELSDLINTLYQPEGGSDDLGSDWAHEAIIIADGARPVGFFKNGEISEWAGDGPFADLFVSFGASLAKSSLSVGRVERDLPAEFEWADRWYCGSAFYVGNGMVVTNRHVLQSLTFGRKSFKTESSRVLPADAFINFSGELLEVTPEGKSVVGEKRFRLEKVIWAPDDAIDLNRTNLAELDLAILGLGPGQTNEDSLPSPLGFDFQEPNADDLIAVIGFPGRAPGLKDPTVERVLNSTPEQILTHFFDRGFGFKRVATGKVLDVGHNSVWNPNLNSIMHDATTLKGNSGSPTFRLDRKNPTETLLVSGCHFFGWSNKFNVAHDAQIIEEKFSELIQASV